MKKYVALLLALSAIAYGAANTYKQPNPSVFYSTVTLPGLSTSAGVVTNSSTGLLSSVAPGTAGNVLASTGSVWASATPAASVSLPVSLANGGFGVSNGSSTAAFSSISPLSVSGDILYETGALTPGRLGIGSSNSVLTVIGGLPSWQANPTPAPTPVYPLSLANGGFGVSNGSSTAAFNSISPITIATSGSTGTANLWIGQGASSALSGGTGILAITSGLPQNSISSATQTVLIGNEIMPTLATSSGNVAIGYNIGSKFTGQQGVLIGNGIANNGTAGNGERNVVIGYAAASGMGGAGGSTVGAHNVIIGYNTGSNISTAATTTIVGYSADGQTSSGTGNSSFGAGSGPTGNWSNSTSIGNGAQATASNSMMFGNTSVTQNYFNGTVNIPTLVLTNPLGAASGGTGLSTVGTSGNVLTSNGTTWTSSTPAYGPLNSESWYDTPSGYGATNTTVRHFTNNQIANGTDITYTGSTTNGDKWVINTAGTYSVTYADGDSAGNCQIGITQNSTALTTSVGSISFANGFRGYIVDAGSTTSLATISNTFHAAVNDVIRAQGDGSCNCAATTCFFNISRVN
jgi:hypothetical protein